MSHWSVAGLQWGDEGKGKLVDVLSDNVDIVIRYQGGHNAGHTIKIEDDTYVLSLLPSGIIRKNVISFIGNGVMLDPFALIEEIDRIKRQGINVSPDRLKISDRAVIVLPFHKKMDALYEEGAIGANIGTTLRGIGPAIQDKVGRRAIRTGDLLYPDYVKKRICDLVSFCNMFFQNQSQPPIDADLIFDELMNIRNQIIPYLVTGWVFLDEAVKSGKKLLFEGAQGALLDIDHGTYPYVTSSNTYMMQSGVGAGISVSNKTFHVGVIKPYATRVGSGPFPTEDDGFYGKKIANAGREFGTITGRPRRCGWFDAVSVRQAATISGIDSLAVMKLDVLDAFDVIKICTHYTLNGQIIRSLPASNAAYYQLRPSYQIFSGWNQSTRLVRTWDELPKNAQIYLEAISNFVEKKIQFISVGPERSEAIMCFAL